MRGRLIVKTSNPVEFPKSDLPKPAEGEHTQTPR